MPRRAVSQLKTRRLARARVPTNQSPGVSTWGNGVVKTVTPGGAADGNAQITVTVGGSDQIAPYLASYVSPTVGDTVRVEITANGSPVIHGRVIGLPNF